MQLKKNVFICNGSGHGWVETGSEWRDYDTGAPAPTSAPLANAGEWVDAETRQPVQVPQVNAAEWVDYERPTVNESQTERFEKFTVAAFLRELREIAGGKLGSQMQSAAADLAAKMVDLLAAIEKTTANGPQANSDGGEWTAYVRPTAE